MISKAKYQEYKGIYDRYHEARNKLFPNQNSLSPEDQAQLPPALPNEQIGEVEVFEFVHDPPTRYLTYVNERTKNITTWVGQILGSVTFGFPFKSNFGDERVPIRVKAINGKQYHGTYYKSAGDYCRIKVVSGL